MTPHASDLGMMPKLRLAFLASNRMIALSIMSSDVTQSAGFDDFVAWLLVNKKRIITGTTVVASAALVISFVVYQKNQHEIKANAALLGLGLPLAQIEGGPNAAALTKVATDFAGTAAAERALLMGAEALYGEGKYSEAYTQFKKFQGEYGGSRLYPIATYGVAVSLDAQNKQDEAITAYDDLIKRFATESVADQARLSLARLFEAKNQPAKALKLYDEVVGGAGGRTGYGYEATDLRAKLLAKHPDLAPATPVPATKSGFAASTNQPKLTAATNAAAGATNAVKK